MIILAGFIIGVLTIVIAVMLDDSTWSDRDE